MEKRQQRTPAEIIAETEARLERLRLRQATAEAKSNPALVPFMEEKADLTKEIREAKKLLGEGPQSAQTRIAKHENWIDKIQTEMQVATEILLVAEARMTEINVEIATAVQSFVNDSEQVLEA